MKICLGIYFISSIMLSSQWALSIYRALYLYNTGKFPFISLLLAALLPSSLFFLGLLIRRLFLLVSWSLMSSNFLSHILLHFPPLSSKSIFKHIFQSLYWISYFGNPIFNFPKLFLASDYSFIPEAYFYFTDVYLIKSLWKNKLIFLSSLLLPKKLHVSSGIRCNFIIMVPLFSFLNVFNDSWFSVYIFLKRIFD